MGKKHLRNEQTKRKGGTQELVKKDVLCMCVCVCGWLDDGARRVRCFKSCQPLSTSCHIWLEYDSRIETYTYSLEHDDGREKNGCKAQKEFYI